jgi:ubiquinone/menaquinone biosynthesis C-methylase UbiE
MNVSTNPVRGSSVAQSALWGARAADWAEDQEANHAALYLDVLEHVALEAGSRVLDAGCGSGLFCVLASKRGLRVFGFDATEPLLAIARTRAPDVEFRKADLESLPYEAASFDLVTGFNSYPYAADPARALAEARRVTRRGGRVVVATWGRPNRCEAAAYLAALKPLMPPPKPGAGGPFALSDETALRALAESVDLAPTSVHDVPCAFEYPTRDAALRALLSAGPAVAAIETSGEEAVRDAVTRALEPFISRSGAVRLENEFRYLVAKA